MKNDVLGTVLYVGMLSLFPVSLLVAVWCVNTQGPVAIVWSFMLCAVAILLWGEDKE